MFSRCAVGFFVFFLSHFFSVSSSYGVTPSEGLYSASLTLPEPLLPIGAVEEDEARALQEALRGFQTAPETLSPLTTFLTEYPTSSYRASLLVNIGILSYQQGRFSQALAAWQEAWHLSKRAFGTEAKAVPERAVAELSRLLGKLGRAEELSKVVEELSGNGISGAAGEVVVHARQALWALTHRVEDSYKCGPYALQTILDTRGPQEMHPQIVAARSSTRGISLTEVSALSKKVGVPLTQAYRLSPKKELPLPAVVHWKLGHFAAVLRHENGRYLVKDKTFDDEFWVTADTLAQEGSGYYLLPSLPKGFRLVSHKEGAAVFGKGVPAVTGTTQLGAADETYGSCSGGGNLPTADKTGTPPQGAPSPGMPTVSVHSMLVSLSVVDTPLWYTPPRGGTQHITVRYLQRDTKQPQTFSYTNFGAKWTSDSLSFLTDNSTVPKGSVSVYLPGGGSETWAAFPSSSNVATQVDGKPTGGFYTVTQISHSPPVYEKRWYNGRVMVYSYADKGTTSRRVFLTEERDGQGNKVTYTYETIAQGVRLTRITDPLGQATTFSYGLTTDPLKVTGATDPFGRTATFTYQAGTLSGITDMGGLTSSFTYTSGLLSQVTTPYGTTSVVRKDSADLSVRSLEVIDPSGDPYRVEYRFYEPGIASLPYQTTTASSYTADSSEYHNTFFWDRDALRLARKPDGTADITKALIVHWGKHEAKGLRYREKPPLQYGTKYFYPTGNTAPVGGFSNWQSPTTLTPGVPTVIKSFFEYLGTSSYGPVVGRRAPGEQAYQYRYDPVTRDLTAVLFGAGTAGHVVTEYKDFVLRRPRTIIDQQGKIWTLGYNSFGQVTSVTDPLLQTTTFSYDTKGYLLSVTRAGGTRSFTYDTMGRVSSVKEPDGYRVTYTYDSLNRLKRTTYPDGTYEEQSYQKLDRVSARDREGRLTQYSYSATRQLLSVKDPLSRTTSFTYCGCGKLESIIDPLGHETRFERDIEGKVTRKVYEDGSAHTLSYYPGTGYLSSITDPKGQTRSFTYDGMNRLTKVTFSGTATPPVTLSYVDGYSSRLQRIIDGSGTTTYSYPVGSFRGLGAWQLSSIDGPKTNDTLTFTYDDLGRLAGTTLNGATTSYSFDALSRLTKDSSSILGDILFTYQGQTARPLSRSVGTPSFSEQYEYFPLPGDPRLKTLSFVKGGVASDAFSYTYSPSGNITSWSGAYRSGATIGGFSFGYNAADELTSATAAQGTTTLASWLYTYDLSGNRTREDQNGTKRIESVVSTTNALRSQTDRSLPSLSVTGGRSFTYDSNGNLSAITEGGVTTSFTWDAADRLLSIKKGSTESRFSYDGMNRWVKIVEVSGTTVTSTKEFIWCGLSLCEERSGTAIKRYFPHGFQDTAGATYYYTRDHLGSVREVRDSAGTIVSRYRYDPYGTRTLVSGTDKSDFGFTGHYLHKPSGLLLAPFRAYSSGLGRWMSRDPIGEGGGLNLYQYVRGSPTKLFDPLGYDAVSAIDVLDDFIRTPGFGGALAGAGALAGGIIATPVGITLGVGVIATPIIVTGINDILNSESTEGKCNRPTVSPSGHRLPAPGMPGTEDGYEPPKGWDGRPVPNPNGKGKGVPDKKGNIWVPTGEGGAAHGGPHWDVQWPRPTGAYDNVYPGGSIRPGRR